MLFVGFTDVMLFPVWYSHLTVASPGWLYAFFAVQPVVFLAFFFEHKRWLKRFEAATGLAAPAS